MSSVALFVANSLNIGPAGTGIGRKVNCGHKVVVAGGVKCTTCNKLFSSTSTRNRHQRTVHKAIADS